MNCSYIEDSSDFVVTVKNKLSSSELCVTSQIIAILRHSITYTYINKHYLVGCQEKEDVIPCESV